MDYITVMPSRDPLELIGIDDFLIDDWDSEGAKAVSDETVSRAEEFLLALPFTFPRGRAMAGIDGSLGIHWTSGGAELYVDFRADGRTRYYFSDRRDVSVEEFLPAGHTVDQLLAAVDRALCWFERSEQFVGVVALEVSAGDDAKWVAAVDVDIQVFDWFDVPEMANVEDLYMETRDEDSLAFSLD